MADATTKRILQLLASGPTAETRAAAALILGELGAADTETARALCTSLDDTESAVRHRALSAVGKLKVQEALPTLLTRVERGGEEAQEAAHSAARLGARG